MPALLNKGEYHKSNVIRHNRREELPLGIAITVRPPLLNLGLPCSEIPLGHSNFTSFFLFHPLLRSPDAFVKLEDLS